MGRLLAQLDQYFKNNDSQDYLCPVRTHNSSFKTLKISQL